MSFQKLVFEACAKIPEGKVCTYSEIAIKIGKPKASRAVGNALNKNRSPEVPCHRVIRSDLKIGGFVQGTKRKIRMLEEEGITIRDEKVADEFLHKFRRSK